MTPELQKALLLHLDALADKFGVGAQALWQIYVGQMRVARLVDWLFIAAFFVSAVVMFSYANIARKKWGHLDRFQEGVAKFVSLTLGIGTLVLFCAAIASALDLIQMHLNPNYWILDAILQSIKGS